MLLLRNFSSFDFLFTCMNLTKKIILLFKFGSVLTQVFGSDKLGINKELKKILNSLTNLFAELLPAVVVGC